MRSGGQTMRDQGMSFRCETVAGGAAVVAAAGYMNAEGGRVIADNVRRLLDRGCQSVLVDLEGTWLVNHNGLLALCALRDEIVRRGGWLGFCNLTATLARTFEVAGLLPA